MSDDTAAGLDQDPQAYLDRRILQPLGITQYQWRSSDKDGKPLMPQGALLSAEEWLAFGEFILRGGQSEDGEQLVDPAAFDAMFEGSPANAAYGLTWWLGRPTSSQDPITSASDIRKNLDKLPGDLVYASGAGNQRLYIIPSRDMVIVRQAELDIEALMSGTGTPWVDTHFLTLLLDGEAASNIVTGAPTPAGEATVADTPSEATTPDGQFITWREHLIDAEDVNGGEPVRGGDGLIVADLDRDGRDDIISVHEDSGHVRIAFAGSSPGDWHLVTLAHGDRVGAVEDVAVGDLNADGWPDLMAACEDAHLIYFENPGETARTHEWDSLIPEVTTGRGSWLRVFIADLNGDGTLDVTAANKGAADIVAPDDAEAVKSTTSLFLLDGPPLQQGSWREQVLLSRGIANTAQPIDVDGDGDLDVLAAARNRQELILLENLGTQADGTLDIAARDIAIAPGFDAPEGWSGQSNAFQSDWADLDRDGRPDLILNVLETVPGETPQLGLGWLEQPSALNKPWIFHRIGNTLPDWIAGLELADIDGDGYLDVMTGGYSGLNILAGAYSGAPRLEDDPHATPSDTVGRMAWFRNPGAAGGEWTRHDISRRVRGMYDAFVAVDLDGDGDTDFVSTRGNSGNLDGVFWLEQVRSDEAQPAFSGARAEDSRQMPLPPENWLSSYRTERTYEPASNTQE